MGSPIRLSLVWGWGPDSFMSSAGSAPCSRPAQSTAKSPQPSPQGAAAAGLHKPQGTHQSAPAQECPLPGRVARASHNRSGTSSAATCPWTFGTVSPCRGLLWRVSRCDPGPRLPSQRPAPLELTGKGGFTSSWQPGRRCWAASSSLLARLLWGTTVGPQLSGPVPLPHLCSHRTQGQ